MKQQLTIIAAMVVVGAAVLGALLLTNKQSAAEDCAKTGVTHNIVIKDDKVNHAHLTATQCDVLKVTNQDAETREIAFGAHEDHVPYNGITERVLEKNQSFSVVLNATGTYRVHDHIHDEVQAIFTVHAIK